MLYLWSLWNELTIAAYKHLCHHLIPLGYGNRASVERGDKVDNGMRVILYEKLTDGTLRQIEERRWSMNMITALEHVNYLIVGRQEYETIEGRLNVDQETLELLLVPMRG